MTLQQFDSNVETVIQTLEAKGYGSTSMQLHKRCYKGLRNWLVVEHRIYSPESVRLWQHSTISDHLHSIGGFANSLDQLLDVYEYGEILPVHFGSQTPVYKLLTTEFRSALDQYLSHQTAAGYSLSYVDEIRIICSQFLMCLQKRGVKNISSVQYDVLIQIYQSNKEQAQSQSLFYEYMSINRGLLSYYAHISVCSQGIPYTLNPHYINKIFLDSSFIPANASKHMPVSLWDGLSSFINKLVSAGYQESTLSTAHVTLVLFFIFLEMNDLAITDEIADLWFKHEKPLLGKAWRCHRRVLKLYLYYRKHHSLTAAITEPTSTMLDRDDVPGWCKPIILKYLELLKGKVLTRILLICIVAAFADLSFILVRSTSLPSKRLRRKL